MKTALCHNQPVTRRLYVTQDFVSFLVNDGCAQWHRQHNVFTRFASTVTTATGLTVLSAKLSREAIVDHGVERCASL